jgi:hypothetical protein
MKSCGRSSSTYASIAYQLFDFPSNRKPWNISMLRICALSAVVRNFRNPSLRMIRAGRIALACSKFTITLALPALHKVFTNRRISFSKHGSWSFKEACMGVLMDDSLVDLCEECLALTQPSYSKSPSEALQCSGLQLYQSDV